MPPVHYKALGEEEIDENKVDETIDDTVKIMDEIVANASLKELKKGLHDKNSDFYLQFKEKGQRIFGIILYTAKKIDDYIDTLNPQDDKAQIDELKILQDCIVALYKDAQSNTDKLPILIETTNKLLDNYEATLTDSKNVHAKNMCKSLYAFTKTLSNTVGNLGFGPRAGASALGLNVTQIQKDIDSLVNRSEQIIGLIDPAEAALTLEEHLDNDLQQKIKKVFTSDPTQTDPLEEMKNYFEPIETGFSELAALKKMQRDIQENMNLGLEGASFSEIVGIDHDNSELAEAFDNIIEKFSDEGGEKQKWQERSKELKNPSTGRQIIDAVSNMASPAGLVAQNIGAGALGYGISGGLAVKDGVMATYNGGVAAYNGVAALWTAASNGIFGEGEAPAQPADDQLEADQHVDGQSVAVPPVDVPPVPDQDNIQSNTTEQPAEGWGLGWWGLRSVAEALWIVSPETTEELAADDKLADDHPEQAADVPPVADQPVPADDQPAPGWGEMLWTVASDAVYTTGTTLGIVSPETTVQLVDVQPVPAEEQAADVQPVNGQPVADAQPVDVPPVPAEDQQSTMEWLKSVAVESKRTQNGDYHNDLNKLLTKRINEVSKQLASGNDEFAQALVEATPEKTTEMADKASILKEIVTLDKKLSIDINKSNTWHARITQKFSKILNKIGFKTPKADLLTTRQKVKQDLEEMRTEILKENAAELPSTEQQPADTVQNFSSFKNRYKQKLAAMKEKVNPTEDETADTSSSFKLN